ncbi:MAG: glycosyltransferase [Candidatus Scalindua sp.]|nr:glycosyltransferase [Candidatus Scalindua sp.]
MKHLIICREYPPAPGGGIGTYVVHISRLLAESGETVHVIGQLWEGAEKTIEEKYHGRLIIHRIHYEDWSTISESKSSPTQKSREEKGLLKSSFKPQCFSWQACLLAEKLIEKESIDIIEAQEYEAPLYYLQLRRALGLGIKRQPPCIVHLHSPIEFIVKHNDGDIGHPYYLTQKRLEDFSISAADALLCPSRYLSRQVESHYRLKEGTVSVIPYPVGDSPGLERGGKTWEQGTICFTGRLERRKGIIEWIDAAVAVAPMYPSVHFEFVGLNVLGTDEMKGEEFLKRRIPDNLIGRFHFRGQQNRSSLFQFLSEARIAVVPSRWENFPNTCIESMCSGLPVIATREGGMAEMIDDGKTGWLTDHAESGELAEALKRALNSSSTTIAEMGHNAMLKINEMCDNNKILKSHIDYRTQIVHKGSKNSLHLPSNLLSAKRPLSNGSACHTSQSKKKEGLAIVVTCFNTGKFLEKCLQSIERQTRKPAIVIIVDNKSTEEQTLKVLRKALMNGWQVIEKNNGDLTPAKNVGIDIVLRSKPDILGFIFLNAEDRLQPDFVAAGESILQRCPEAGLVSCWTQMCGTDNSIWINPCPSFPYQWLSNEAVSFSVVRAEALTEAGDFRTIMIGGYDIWDLFNAVMAAGWVGVTIPGIMGDTWVWNDSPKYISSISRYGKMRRHILERFPDLVARDAKEIVLLAQFNVEWQKGKVYFPHGKYSIKTQKILQSPVGIFLRILRKAKNKIRRHLPCWLTNFIFRSIR